MRTPPAASRRPSCWPTPINRAKSTDPEAVVKAFCATNIPGDQIINPWKGIKFDPKTHQNIYAAAMIVQIQDQALLYGLALGCRQPRRSMAVPGLEGPQVKRKADGRTAG